MDSLLSLMSFSLSAPYLAGPAAGAAYGSVPVRDSSRTSTGSSRSAMGYRVSMASSRLSEARDVALDGARSVPFRLVRETPHPFAFLGDDVAEYPPVGQLGGEDVRTSGPCRGSAHLHVVDAEPSFRFGIRVGHEPRVEAVAVQPRVVYVVVSASDSGGQLGEHAFADDGLADAQAVVDIAPV
ncbi:hypothetical protein GA622_07480 [Bifidobacterium adolescentis]|uniref:hypothetical protein n=1 Tax=Bifidobacterium adolescentis TaxID=1680 RepID=UPI00101F8E01|nr:hypothetical protein [Bifidobacterium adolescentis]KAB5818442.1 hypothetical protein GA651_08670 [Bifidobacterium adolescentis]KAB5822815.1 hypothetical protein GA670_09085 [Bifidobacterium adolescentis]KAB5828970.1 hypothetical protein GA665_08700 [Bifidobacterium adolescentis]KAB5829298.1 hypothetical protein GA669_08590 [Bifidobacterium adolescentis]KAB5832495.1 hypothetical protein GA666_05865 [Bifidobacterium adolescentis]